MNEIFKVPEVDHVCPCCGQHYGSIPIGSWMAYIGGFHTVYISTDNDPHTPLAYDNDPAEAARNSWIKWEKLIKGEIEETDRKSCVQLEHFIKAELNVMKKHLSEHKWFQHITDDNLALADFNEKYGWIMREMYCGNSCPERFKCELAKKFLQNDDEENKNESNVMGCC